MNLFLREGSIPIDISLGKFRVGRRSRVSYQSGRMMSLLLKKFRWREVPLLWEPVYEVFRKVENCSNEKHTFIHLKDISKCDNVLFLPQGLCVIFTYCYWFYFTQQYQISYLATFLRRIRSILMSNVIYVLKEFWSVNISLKLYKTRRKC